MSLTLIAAMSENRVIGRGGGLPWRLPDDMRHFKQVTMGHPVVMGRRTWESMGGPLPGRRNIVLSRRVGYTAEGAEVVTTLDAALARAGSGAATATATTAAGRTEDGAVGDPSPVFVIGGGEIYDLALPRADRLDLTIVHAILTGDAFFPAWDPAEWRLVSERHHPADERHAHAFTFQVHERA